MFKNCTLLASFQNSVFSSVSVSDSDSVIILTDSMSKWCERFSDWWWLRRFPMEVKQWQIFLKQKTLLNCTTFTALTLLAF